MAQKKDDIQENVNAELGGMGLYGTTSNFEIGGYEATGDIENAGRLDKGFKSQQGRIDATASVREEDQ